MKKAEPWVKCLSSRIIVYSVTIIGIIIMLILGALLYRKLLATEFALESCRSSAIE